VPETKGHTLEETALLFDGADAVANLSKDAARQAELDANLSEGDIVKASPDDATTGTPGEDEEKGWAASHHEHSTLPENTVPQK